MHDDVDVALLPANLAAVLYNKLKATPDAAIQVAAINTLGMLEVLEQGDTVRTIADLKGKTIYSTGKGASPEYVLDYLLKQNGLDPATDVTVEFKSEATEVAAVLASTPGAIGVLPQPYVTVLKAKSPTIRTALTLTDEWAKVTKDSQMVTGVVVVRRAFAEKNPAAFADFLTACRWRGWCRHRLKCRARGAARGTPASRSRVSSRRPCQCRTRRGSCQRQAYRAG